MAVLHFPGFQHFWSLLKALLDLKAPLESPELTGDPTAPTQEPHDNSTKVATTEYVDSAVAELVNSSPAALDTLKELSDAIGGDANFSTTMTNALALKAPLASPALTGSPTAPTQNAGDNSTKIATTAYADRNDAACVHLAGAETVSGAKTFTGAQTFQAISNFLDSATPFLEFTWPDVTRGTNPSAQKWAGYRFLDKAKTTGVKQRAAACEVGLTVDGETNIALKAYDWTLNSTKMEQIGIAYPKGGTPYTFAPTPAAGDNSTKIATTAFVTTAVANEDATCVHLTGNETIAGTKTFSSTITGSVSGNAGTATKIQTAPSGTSWVNGVKAGGALVSSTSTSYGAVFNAPTKNYRVSLGTYPSSDDLVYLLSITNANVTAGTNTTNKTLTWNAANGTLAATSFSGPLVGNVTGNCSGSSGSCTGNAKTATTLATARDINISDADGTNTGTKISFNGSANGTIKLPATIKASITGNCSGSSGSCTGNAATATKTTATIAVDKTGELVHATMGSNDLFRIAVGGGSNAGWAEIATGDDYSEPIYVRQYQGSFATLKRTATLLDGSGNTSFPGTVTANSFSGPLVGNVTGNCSGSSGSCTGNAKTATTLATARTIAISGGATGTATSFNGSANITIPVTALDVSKASAGTLAVARGGTGLTSLDTFVRTTGNQTIAGSKTFSSEIIVNKGDKPAAGALSHAFAVTFLNAAGGITHTAHPISVIGTSNESNAYNTGVRIGSLNGTTVITAGESGGNFCSTLNKYDDEVLYLTADNEVQIYCKCANDMATYAGPIRFSGSGNASGGTTSITATTFIGALTGNCSGTASNVTGTVAIANGGTGATTLPNARKALFGENMTTTNATNFAMIGDNWEHCGWLSIAEAQTVLGLKSAAYTESSAYATSGHTHSYLPLSGGTMTGNLVLNNAKIIQEKVTSMTRATAPSANVCYWPLQFVDNAGKVAGGMYYEYHTDKQAQTLLMCYRGTTNDNTWNSLRVGYDKNGNWFTYAPTPATGDNSTKIATTAFVNTKCGNYLPLSGGTMTGQIKITRGNADAGGGIRFEGKGQNYAISIMDTNVTKGTDPGSSHYMGIDFYGKTNSSYKNRIGLLQCTYAKGNVSEVGIYAYNCTSAEGTGTCAITCKVDGSGNSITYAPTPAAADNSTKIATTAWVRTFVGTTWAPTNIAPKYASGTEVDAGGGYTTPKAGVVSAWVTTGWWFEAGEVTVGAYTHRLGVRNGSEQAQFFLPVAKGVYVKNAGGMDGVRFYPV